MIDTVIFDLDGTLLDTAPDIAAALNQVLTEHGRQPLPPKDLCPHIALGVAEMVKHAFGITPDAPDFDSICNRALTLYGENLNTQTCLFPGMDDTLTALEHHHIAWGVCTNKSAALTAPVLAAFGLDSRASCAVSGDTLPVNKPHPEPLWHALKLCGNRQPENSIFVGDAITDMQAGRAAGMKTVGALYGYIQPGENPATDWPADDFIQQPADLLDIIGINMQATS